MKNEIISFLSNSLEKYGYQGAVIGISGGIDSAVTGALLVEALGRDRVFGLLLPERDSSPDTVRDSRLVCRHLGIEYKLIRLTGILRKKGIYRMHPPALFFPRKVQEWYTRKVWEEEGDTYIKDLKSSGSETFLKGLAYYRIKHRTRMTMLYFEAEKRHYAVVGSTNRTEVKMGFYVKWGDDSVDFEPLSHLYKTEVYRLAGELGVPGRIIEKPASPDIAPGITDEYAMGVSYEDIDRILKKLEGGKDLSSEKPENVARVTTILNYSAYREIRSLGLSDKLP